MTSLLLDEAAPRTFALPRLHLIPAATSSEGPDAVWFAAQHGMTADPWQEWTIGHHLGLLPSGLWSAPRAGISVGRQNGKNGEQEIVDVYKLAVLGRRILHTAHQVKTAVKAFRRLRYFFGEKPNDPLARFPHLNAMVLELRKQNGSEAIFLNNGASWELVARSRASGLGFSVDDLNCDESQEMTDADYEALLPTISASSNPQTTLMGTPPTGHDPAKGVVFARFREAALLGTDPRLLWVEYSCPDGVDLDSREAWQQANPSLGIRLSYETTADERATMSDETFARARLGMWSAGLSSLRVIPANVWAALADVDSRPTETAAYGIDVSLDSTKASIGLAAWREDGRRHVEFGEGHAIGDEVTGHKILGTTVIQSVEWVVPVAEAIAARRKAVFVVEAQSPAAALVEPLKRAGVDVLPISTGEFANACVRFYNEAHEGLLAHLDQPSLNFALSVARKKAYGKEGKWQWHRRSADSDITPLSAVTLAMHGLSARKPRSNSASFF